MSDAEIISFHGPDGCGKSTLARSFAEVGGPGNKTTILGGSSYKHWLTPQVARETLGDSSWVGTVSSSPEEKRLLYERIAVCCYGLAAHKAHDLGQRVLIDSDPIIKRFVWARLEHDIDGVSLATYEKVFGSFVALHVTPDAFPDAVIYVGGNLSSNDLHDRIKMRGGDSEYDPQDLADVKSIQATADDLWGELQSAKRGLSNITLFNTHFAEATLVAIENPKSLPSEFTNSMARLAFRLTHDMDTQ